MAGHGGINELIVLIEAKNSLGSHPFPSLACQPFAPLKPGPVWPIEFQQDLPLQAVCLADSRQAEQWVGYRCHGFVKETNSATAERRYRHYGTVAPLRA